MAKFRLETDRLILREWSDTDLEPFHAMSNDPRVMETLGPLMDRDRVSATIDRMRDEQRRNGHCFWALETRDEAQFIGWCGLIRGSAPTITGKPEIGWRLAHHAWGQGYAREAAQASLEWGWTHLPDERIWAITTPGNVRSRRLMERLGMARHPDLDFDHPNVADGNPLKSHITYSIALPA